MTNDQYWDGHVLVIVPEMNRAASYSTISLSARSSNTVIFAVRRIRAIATLVELNPLYKPAL